MILSTENPFFLQLAGAVKEFEGCTDFFYLDTRGLVTIGIGHMVQEMKWAPRLGDFSYGSRDASDEEIMSDFARVYSSPFGAEYGADYYEPKTISRLRSKSINPVFAIDLMDFQNQLIHEIPVFEHFPEQAQIACLDMAFNMGVNRLMSEFPTFTRHARDKDLAGMLAECKRTEDSANAIRRNEWTEARFREAIAA